MAVSRLTVSSFTGNEHILLPQVIYEDLLYILTAIEKGEYRINFSNPVSV